MNLYLNQEHKNSSISLTFPLKNYLLSVENYTYESQL